MAAGDSSGRIVAAISAKSKWDINLTVTPGEECQALESPVQGNCASWYVVLNPCCRQEEFRGRLLGHRVYLKGKPRGEKSMPEKREALEGV